MIRMGLGMAGVVLIVAIPLNAAAQTCLGGVPLSSAKGVSWQLGGAVGTSSATRSYTLEGQMLGGYKQAFGDLRVSRVQFLDLGYDLIGFAIDGGYRIPIGRTEVCPRATYERSIAEDLGPSLLPPHDVVMVRQLTVSSGISASIGVPATTFHRATLVPTVTVALDRARTTSEFLFEPEQPAESVLVLQPGLGFILGKRFAVVASVGLMAWSSSEIENSVTFSVSATVKLTR